MSIDFQQLTIAVDTGIEVFAVWAHLTVATVHRLDPACAGYAVVAAVWLWRA